MDSFNPLLFTLLQPKFAKQDKCFFVNVPLFSLMTKLQMLFDGTKIHDNIYNTFVEYHTCMLFFAWLLETIRLQAVSNTFSPWFQSYIIFTANLCHFALLHAFILTLEATHYI